MTRLTDSGPRHTYEVVVPTIGRPSLARLLRSLGDAAGPPPDGVWLVDDRPDPDGPPIDDDLRARLPCAVHVVRSGGRGPAAARNAGWRSTTAPWVAFLDDDVVVDSRWCHDLVADVSSLDVDEVACQGRVEVPLPGGRRPTDWERTVASLATAEWVTADMVVARRALEVVGGFDERFPRAYREDTDLALRLMAAGFTLTRGRRRIHHPVGPAGPWTSVRRQAGNRDDAMMRALHGREWRRHGGAPPGRLPRHLATVAAAGVGLAGAVLGRPRIAAAGASLWAAMTASFAVSRVRPGPPDPTEVATMVATSVVIPFAATAHRVAGEAAAVRVRRERSRLAPGPVEAVLFDRDGTLVHDVPYNGDPEQVRSVPGAALALDRLRRRGIAVGVITNQSGIGRGILEEEEVTAVDARIADELGPFSTWQRCPHAPWDGCSCRKPAPGMVHAAAEALAVRPERLVVVGDIGADLWAARSAGAGSILVPTARTRRVEVSLAAHVAPDLPTAVAMIEETVR